MKDIRREVSAGVRAARPVGSVRHAACSLSAYVTAPSTGYRRLALATGRGHLRCSSSLGGIVRVSDSGLGCGQAHAASTAGRSATATWCPAWSLHAHDRVLPPHHGRRRGRAHGDARRAGLAPLPRLPPDRVAATAASLLVVAQAVLGAATVEQNLNEALVAAHLGLAMLLFGGLICIGRASRPGRRRRRAAGRRARLPVAGRGHLQAILFVHDRGRRLHGGHRSTSAAPAPAGRRRPRGLRQGVPRLRTRRLHAVRPVAAREHPARPPAWPCTSPRCWRVARVIVMILRAGRAPRDAQLALAARPACSCSSSLLGVLNVWLDDYETLIAAPPHRGHAPVGER